MIEAKVILTDTQLDQLAELIAERLRADHDVPRSSCLVDALTVAQVLGVSRETVYAHATELGGERIGNGPRPRLRFDLDLALEAWTSRSRSKESQRAESPTPAGRSTRRRPRSLGSGVELLPIHGSALLAEDDRERP